MSNTSRLQALRQSTALVNIDLLMDFYDSLEALSPAFMLGEWDGGVFNTGHPGEKQLDALNWRGKTFRDANDVEPIVVHTADGMRTANNVLGKASLRSVAYRGVHTATMVYDNHPIFDHFRLIDESTVLGVMDRKGDSFPLFFYLQRV